MRPLAVALALASSVGILLASRLAYADLLAHRGTPQALERAAALDGSFTPASYFERLAELDPAQGSRWLDAALGVNPRSSQDWIAQGLAAERDHHLAAAERDLLQAASADHQYLPAWTLTNFYFRRDRRSEFWTWAHRAAALTYDDYRPLLELAHQLEPSPRVAIERLGGSVPLLRADVDFLVQQGAFEQAQQAARLLLARNTGADAPRLLALADRQVQAGNASAASARDALEIWNAIHPTLDPDRDAVANGDLARASSGLVFDWRLQQGDGFSTSFQTGTLTFRLTGQQRESCILLEQFVPLDPARRYRLRYEYQTAGLPPATGLLWELNDAPAPIPAASSWRDAAAVLALPTHARSALRIAKLRLLYQRAPGSVRAAGEIQLHRYRLEVL